ncbi:ABC transporter substrate-binding protein [Mycobacterium sp. Y57]|uniref:ABC transporter substrate-binding protein n=1 Tax=Mycolicibacterium xanthum TaxID=2796469 RepID=UPI001C84297E|nr:ABC transporter substrate-binding protein [Mycolicibacterium xanthum]MBX7432952.1 ABC transporter substrate-binding protein [Mycolicibacterium xanthum]
MGTLRVGIAYPDPPFNGMPGDTGLDVELMTAVAERLGESAEFIRYAGADAGGVIDGLCAGACDCAAGITVTVERQRVVAFTPAYLITGQALAVDTARHPHVRSVDDLAGLTVGVCATGAGRPLAQRLAAAGRVGAVETFDGGIGAALSALTSGGCDAVFGQGPALTESTKPLTGVDVVQKGLSTDPVAIAVAAHDGHLLGRIGDALSALESDGTLQRLRRRWLGNPYTDQSLATL